LKLKISFILFFLPLIFFQIVIPESARSEIKIMPLGDSITQGVSSGVAEDSRVSYRKDLWDQLGTAGHEVNFVGSLNNGSAIPNFDPNHEGHPGWRADEIVNGRASDPGAGRLDVWLLNHQPDIVLLHIGTNDISFNNEDPGEIDDILDEIDLYSSDVWVILARIIKRSCNPYIPPCSKSLQTTTFNNDVVTLVAEPRINGGDKIIVVDMENGANIDYRWEPAGDMSDDLHPFRTGYEKMADVWFAVFSQILPVADAGPDQNADEGNTVPLDGSGSFDPKGGNLSYRWEQTSGTAALLSDDQAEKPTFTAPDVGSSGDTLTFKLTVTDEGVLESTDTTSIEVHNPTSGGGGGGGGGCFIASATHGSPPALNLSVVTPLLTLFLLAVISAIVRLAIRKVRLENCSPS
jgi:lysophospholipase L1-like esterase